MANTMYLFCFNRDNDMYITDSKEKMMGAVNKANFPNDEIYERTAAEA